MKEINEIKQLILTHDAATKKNAVEIQSISSKMDRILFILEGDDKAQIEGLAAKCERHDKYIRKDKQIKWTIAGILTGANGGFWLWVKSHLNI